MIGRQVQACTGVHDFRSVYTKTCQPTRPLLPSGSKLSQSKCDTLLGARNEAAAVTCSHPGSL